MILEESEEAVVVEEELITPNGLVLKELPTHLRYAFLGENSTKPLIISTALNDEMDNELFLVLKRNIGAFAWCIDDIKRIIPLVCMHKILIEYDAKPIVEHQRRLNPILKEVVKKEVLKWLNVGFIYAISDSTWVSHVSCS